MADSLSRKNDEIYTIVVSHRISVPQPNPDLRSKDSVIGSAEYIADITVGNKDQSIYGGRNFRGNFSPTGRGRVTRSFNGETLDDLAEVIANSEAELGIEDELTTITAPRMSWSDYCVSKPISAETLVEFRAAYFKHSKQ